MKKRESQTRISASNVFIIYKYFNKDALEYSIKMIEFLNNLKMFDIIFVEELSSYMSLAERLNIPIRESIFPQDNDLDLQLNSNYSTSIVKYNKLENKSDVDLVIIIGGDGTVLWGNSLFSQCKKPPFLTFNLGTLGYLTYFSCSEYERIFTELFLKEETIISYERRSCLEVNYIPKENDTEDSSINKFNKLKELVIPGKEIKITNGAYNKGNIDNGNSGLVNNGKNSITSVSNNTKNNNYNVTPNTEENSEYNSSLKQKLNEHPQFLSYLNEIIFTKSDCHMIKSHVFINGKELNTIRSDGIIISTSTGSTAYNLSSGGPICHYDLDVLILNAICPFTLSFRPIIFAKDVKIKVILDEHSAPASVSGDGQDNFVINPGEGVEVGLSDYDLSIIILDNLVSSPLDNWRHKMINQLGWSTEFKNA